MKGSKIFLTNTKAISVFQHPSISICPKYMFKKVPFMKQLFSNASNAAKKILVDQNRWTKQEVFYFVNHPGMLDLRYPCVTVNDGADPGKPCSFPFK